MKSKYEQKQKEDKTKPIECTHKCTHKCETKDCLIRVSGKYTYQCLVCGEIIYKREKN